MDEPKNAWQESLARDLDFWFQASGLKYKAQIAEALGIPMSVWGSISAGHSIAKDTEVYAKIFRFTGLQSSDPRQIPPLRRYQPHRKSFYEQERAWTEKEWQEWVSTKGKNVPFAQTSTQEPKQTHKLPVVGLQAKTEPQPIRRNVEASQKPEKSTQTIGSFVDAFVDTLGAQLGRQIGSYVAQALTDTLAAQEKHVPSPKEEKLSMNIGELATGLYKTLEYYASTTKEDRSKVFSLYRDALLDLLPLLDAFCQPDKDRETALRLLGRS